MVENEVRPYTDRSCKKQLRCCSEAVGIDQKFLIPLVGLGRMDCVGDESITRRGGSFSCSLGVNGRGLVKMVIKDKEVDNRFWSFLETAFTGLADRLNIE